MADRIIWWDRGVLPGLPYSGTPEYKCRNNVWTLSKNEKEKKKRELTVGIYVEQGENWGSWWLRKGVWTNYLRFQRNLRPIRWLCRCRTILELELTNGHCPNRHGCLWPNWPICPIRWLTGHKWTILAPDSDIWTLPDRTWPPLEK